jgi:hypothetical protein
MVIIQVIVLESGEITVLPMVARATPYEAIVWSIESFDTKFARQVQLDFKQAADEFFVDSTSASSGMVKLDTKLYDPSDLTTGMCHGAVMGKAVNPMARPTTYEYSVSTFDQFGAPGKVLDPKIIIDQP